MISQSSIEQLKGAIDIVDIVGNYLELKKAGANFKTKCPFHSEKTSSFVVSPSKQIFHCFGCGVGGDAIKFVMEIEKLSYPEAIEKIAFLYNIPLQYEKSQNRGAYLEISKVLEMVQKWYRRNLDKNQAVQDYLKSRGISQSSIEDFGIGFAPRDGLIEFLKKNFIPLPKANEAGVINQDKSSGRLYARLVERVTFPIYSQSGLIVGFGGRTITNHPAKYINSPQTKLFNKSRLLYGYHRAKEAIFREKEVIVCEGYLDVIMLHQAGFKRAVATLGTALTKEHLPILKKGNPKVLLSYDGDKAGLNAGFKASKLLAIDGFDGGVVIFPAGLDPADLVKARELKELDRLFQNPKPFVEFVLEQIASNYELKNPVEKERAFKESKSFLEQLSPIIRDEYATKASLILGVSESYFKSRSGVDSKDENPEFQNQKGDLLWASIIKTVLENSRLLDELLDVVSLEMAGESREILEALISGDLESEKLVKIMIDESIKPLTGDEFKRALLIQLEKFYQKRLREIIRSKGLDFSKKSYWIRKIKTDIIPRIKKGELVVYESNIPI
jgi:DNA primase